MNASQTFSKLVSFSASWIILGALLGALPGHAETVCQYYRREAPNLYKMLCVNSNGVVESKPAGASSTFSSGFSMNSASLPTEPTSYGLETIVSYFNHNGGLNWTPTFALVKGFQKFGTGVSTSGNNTFYGNDIVQRAHGSSQVTSFDPDEPANGSLVNLNLGTSVNVLEFNHGPTFRLGFSARYNKTTDSLGGGPGLMVNWNRFTFGGGYTRERVSNYLPRVTFYNLMTSMRLWIFEFEYSYLKNDGGFDLKPIQIFTTTATIRRLTLTFAVRKLNYFQEGDVTQTHFAIQYLFSKNFSAGYLVNYIPGTASLGIQYYL